MLEKCFLAVRVVMMIFEIRTCYLWRWIFLATGVVIFIGAVAHAATDWQREKSTRDGIVVYSRSTPGTTIREVRAKLIIAAPPKVVLEAACAPETFKETTDKYVERNQIYKGQTDNVWFNYQLVNYPVIARRDYCLRYEKILDENKGLYQLKWRVSNRYSPPPKEDIVRVSTVNGIIDITPLGAGQKSLMRYTLMADPGGNIPTWIINLANRTSLPDILRQIRDAARQRNRSRSSGE